jgi:hypothetical protein
MSLAFWKYFHLSEVPQFVRDFSAITPLLAAIFAPLAVLFDILGLSVRLDHMIWRLCFHSYLQLSRKNGPPREV